MEVGRSFKLGVIRLTERFIKSDPLAPRDERKLNRYLDAELGKYLDQIRRAGFDRVVGTSGTILSLGAVAQAERHQPAGSSLRNRRITAKQLHRDAEDARVARPAGAPARAGPRTPARGPRRGRGHPARRHPPPPGRRGHHALRSVAARRPRARLRGAAPQGNRPGGSVPRRPPAQRLRAGRTLQLLAGARAAGGAAVARPLRPDARRPRADGSRTRVAGVRGAAARHRRAHQLRTPSQAFRLPHQERRSARLRAGRGRDDRARRPVSPAGHAQTPARELRGVRAQAPPDHPHAGGHPAPGGRPRPQSLAADRRPGIARPRRRRAAPAPGRRGRRARAVGGDAARGGLRAADRQAAASRGRRERGRRTDTC